MIEQYREGSYLKIGGTQYYNDLKIIDGQVRARWWRDQGHRLQTEDIYDILAAKPKILVIGTGYAGNLRVSDENRDGDRDFQPPAGRRQGGRRRVSPDLLKATGR